MQQVTTILDEFRTRTKIITLEKSPVTADTMQRYKVKTVDIARFNSEEAARKAFKAATGKGTRKHEV